MPRIDNMITLGANVAAGLLLAAALLVRSSHPLAAQKQPPHCGGTSSESCYIIEKCSVAFEADGRTCTGEYSRLTWYYRNRS